MTQKIFISYRRDDSADVTGRIYDRLVAQFGKENVFKDVDSIPFGVDFKEHLTEAVQQCAIQLVVIGRDWLTITDKTGRRRLDDPRDFVRIEIEAALSRKIPVVPLLVMNAGMPDEEHLPPSLTGLVYRNGTGIRRDPDFHRDVDRLIAALKTHFANTAVPTTPQPSLQTIVTPQTDVATSKLVLPMLEWVSIPTGNVTLKINPLQLHHVEAFQISKYPVTHEQFQIFIEDDGYLNDRWWHGLTNRETKPANGQWPIPKHPRENVNWYEAIAFTRWLSNKTGLNITLPTEMEWQRAAEGDSESIYPWGEEFDKKRCNTKISEIGKTTRVDRYPSGVSQFGVMDMSGNVWEWCLNEFDVPSRISTEGDAMRAARGGGWRYHALTTQTSFRNYFNPDERFDCVGFRIALIGMSPFFDRQ